MAKRREDEMSSAEVPENGRIKIDAIIPAFRPGDKLEQLLKRSQKADLASKQDHYHEYGTPVLECRALRAAV